MRRNSCEYNIDTACVEIRCDNGTTIAIDCIAVEYQFARNLYERSELDWLIYNKPLEYVQLVLNGELEEYLRQPYEHRLAD